MNYIRENSSEATISFNLRTQYKIENYYAYNKNGWKKLALYLLKPNKTMLLVKELIGEMKTVNDAIKEFVSETGLSRSTFFNYKRMLGVKV